MIYRVLSHPRVLVVSPVSHPPLCVVALLAVCGLFPPRAFFTLLLARLSAILCFTCFPFVPFHSPCSLVSALAPRFMFYSIVCFLLCCVVSMTLACRHLSSLPLSGSLFIPSPNPRSASDPRRSSHASPQPVSRHLSLPTCLHRWGFFQRINNLTPSRCIWVVSPRSPLTVL